MVQLAGSELSRSNRPALPSNPLERMFQVSLFPIG